jgi:hypothetical protein
MSKISPLPRGLAMRASFALCTAAMLATHGAQADATQPAVTLPVGSPAFDGHRIQPYENVWRYTATLPDGSTKVQGLWTDRLDTIDKDGRKLMRRIQAMAYYNGITTSQINIFDPSTMAAVTSEVHKTDGSWLKRSFDGASVQETRGTSPGDAKGVQTVMKLPAPVFDFWGGMYGTLLAALPLRVGYEGTLPSIDEFESRYKPASFKVVREEMFDAGKLGKQNVWVVETEGMTFRISTNAPYILKLDVPMGKDTTAHWDEL